MFCMSKINNDFFVKKKDWSLVKDELLGCYLKPYVSKILGTYKPLIYVDCFAGKGKFEDGKDGSPLIALKIIDECCKSTKMEKIKIETIFIDLNYTDFLKENLRGYPWVKIISGKYEEKIHSALSGKENCNVFLYIDPYGIKALRASLFAKLSKASFNSVELLINMNSFGFFREACHALGYPTPQLGDDKFFDDLYEYEPTWLDATDKSIKTLNEIAGGDYWQDIVKDYKKGKIDGYVAEAKITEQYCANLMKSYKYVLNMPIRIKVGQQPKYRLIHATNHRDGCLLMVDNICKRWETLQEIQSGGMMSLFPESCDNQMINEDDLKEKCIDFFSQYMHTISLSDGLAGFFVKYGPICSTSDLNKIIKNLEKGDRIKIMRCPAFTAKGKVTTFMSEKNGQKVSVRWIK